ncbi:hypothetical protein TRVL_01295 [Trypanosoma vivax]|nr:hypothetical protein TRVL_01295 [Trypanosoma vivax]
MALFAAFPPDMAANFAVHYVTLALSELSSLPTASEAASSFVVVVIVVITDCVLLAISSAWPSSSATCRKGPCQPASSSSVSSASRADSDAALLIIVKHPGDGAHSLSFPQR